MNKQVLFAVIPALFASLIGSSIASATPLSSQSGTISSIQNGTDGKPEWKVSGTWNLANLRSNTPTFNASFDMMKLDGSSKHKHTINATIPSVDFLVAGKSSIRAYSGTATISMKEGPVSDVPIVIRLSSDGNINIMPDPTKTKGHFGNTPIQGKTNM
ncbi:MAG: hypothetical protein ACJ71K_11310 [Nitrososphaeraceae archaeon]|jgi:hypothetical protein